MGNANWHDVGFQSGTWVAETAAGSVNFPTSVFEEAFIGSAGDGRL